MADKAAPQKRYWWRPLGQRQAACPPAPRAGQLCPHCQQAALAYDSLFMLACPYCGYTAEGGAFT